MNLLLPNKIKCIGDYKQHKGIPSLLRSNSMLKAIGKALNIKVSSHSSSTIPIIILGNSPITESYIEKVDFLKSAGLIQGFWSLNPNIIEIEINSTPQKGFQTIYNEKELFLNCQTLINNKNFYFSAMLSKQSLGKIISIANQENTDIKKAEKFLSLIKQ